jgi:hypothetical protein
MHKGVISAVVAALFAAGAGVGVAGLAGFPPDDLIHWRDVLADHDSFPHSADWVAFVVLAAVAYWRGLADAE